MSRRSTGIRRPLLVTLYVAILTAWAALTYDTYGVWLRRQEYIARGLALAALGPTERPPPIDVPIVATVTPTIVPTLAADTSPTATALATPYIPPTATPAPLAILHPKTGRFIAAWLPTAFDADKARESFEANKALLDEVSPYWYTASPQDGSLVIEPGGRDLSLVETAHAANVLVIPTIHNVYDPNAILPLLQDPARRKAHVDKILHEIMTYDFDGIDIDYEMLPPSSRPDYNNFMTELSIALRSEGKLLTVAVHAKTSDDGGASNFQDWALLGQLCDRIRIMAYDYHWQGSQPGPIAPLGWVSAVTEYARSVIPPPKIQLGIPFYAYDWATGENARPATWADVQALINQYQPIVNLQERDAAGPVEETWFSYTADGKSRTVWFSSSRALEAKLDLIETKDLGGLVIWRLGNEDPRNWEVIRSRLIEHPAVTQRLFDTFLPEH